MRLSALRYSMVVLSAAGLTVAAVPSAQAGPARPSAKSIGDKCLIGTWHDNRGTTTTRWNGVLVSMHAGGGDVDHIAASGVDHDSWAKSLPIVGKYLGHKLTERVRGHNKQRIHASGKGHHRKLVITEEGWKAGSSNRYVYRGVHSTGYLNQTGVHSYGYRCSSTTLTILGPKGRIKGTETRLSSKP